MMKMDHKPANLCLLGLVVSFAFGSTLVNADPSKVKQSNQDRSSPKNSQNTKEKSRMNKGSTRMPKKNQVASEFVTSPLRNRIRVELNAPVSQVWSLIGDLSRFPE